MRPNPRWAHRALNSLRDLARTFPVLQPRVNLYAGQISRLSGQSHQMMVDWRKCLELSRKFDLPYEMACAHYQLAEWGLHTRAADPLASETERRAHIGSAQRLFASLECAVVEKAMTDAQAIRLHLNPKLHQIERGTQETVIWPTMHHATGGTLRLFLARYISCFRKQAGAEP
jgi:hypothetical protein